MSIEKDLKRPASEKQKSDIQLLIDACWASSDFVAKRSEKQRPIAQAQLTISPQQAVDLYMDIAEYDLALAVGPNNELQTRPRDVSTDGRYKKAAVELIDGLTRTLGFESHAFNQVVVAMVLSATDEIRDVDVLDVVLPSQWSVLRRMENGQERVDSRIEGNTSAQEDQQAARFYKTVRATLFDASRERTGWGESEQSGQRAYYDARDIENFELYEKLKNDDSSQNKFERFKQIAKEKGFGPESQDTIEKSVRRGRELAKERGLISPE